MENSFLDINNTNSEQQLEEPDTNQPKDHDDHEDRYFEIEEPAYLNCSYEHSFDDKQAEEKNETRACNEQLFSFANNNEHEPLDNKTVVTTATSFKPEPELLGQHTLR